MTVLLLFLLVSTQPYHQPRLVHAGDCGWVHGRYSVYNGSGLRRIWMIGTTHMLNLYDDDEDLPAVIKSLYDTGKFVPFKHEIYGDFFLCARERRIQGHMQHVRWRAAKNLVVVAYDDENLK